MITPDSLDIVSPITNSSNNTSTPPDDSGPPVEMPSLFDILEQYPTYLWSKYLGLYIYPVIIFLGTIGNLISFIVMMRKTMIRSSTCFYLAVIAVVDTMVLFFSGIRSWFAVINGWDAIILSPTACKVFNFLTYFFFQYSAWLLVAMTIERFIAIHFPLKAVEFATVSRAKKVTIGLFVLFVLINSHFFWTVTISGQYCSPTVDYEDFHDDIFPLIDATLYSFIPFLVLLTINVLIIRDNKRATRFRETLRRRSNTAENEKTLENRHFHQKLTIMLLSVTFTFLVTSAPRVILFSIRFNYFDFSSYPIDFERLALYLLVSRITSLFSYMNHAVNFLLYCITGQRFRRELRKLFVCKQQSQTTTLYSTSTDRYRRRPSSTSITNMELPENPSCSTHISHDTSYSIQTSHTQSNIICSSQKPSNSTQTKSSQNPDPDFSQIPDPDFSQNSDNDSNLELPHNFNEDNLTEISQNLNEGGRRKQPQNLEEDSFAEFPHFTNVSSLTDFPYNFNGYTLTEFGNTVTEHPQNTNEGNVTEHTQNMNEGNVTEHTQNMNEGNVTEHPQNMNEGSLTEHPQNMNEGSLTEHPQNMNEGSLTEHPQNMNEGSLTEHPQNMNEGSLTEHPQNMNEGNVTEHPQNMNEGSLTEHPQNMNEGSLTEHPQNMNEGSLTEHPQNMNEGNLTEHQKTNNEHNLKEHSSMLTISVTELSENPNTEHSLDINKAISTELSQAMNKNTHTTLSQNIFSITNRDL